jgi:hypothetical protein
MVAAADICGPNLRSRPRGPFPLAVAGLLGVLAGCAYPVYPDYGYPGGPAYADYPGGYGSGYAYGYVPSGAYAGFSGGWGRSSGGGWGHDDWHRDDRDHGAWPAGGWTGHQTATAHPGGWTAGHSNPGPAGSAPRFTRAAHPAPPVRRPPGGDHG